jgi:hypothetical protein
MPKQAIAGSGREQDETSSVRLNMTSSPSTLPVHRYRPAGLEMEAERAMLVLGNLDGAQAVPFEV